jgi:hypothetical protein
MGFSMDFYRFVSNITVAERIVTQLYPMIIAEFERRFNISVKKSWIDMQYDCRLPRYEVRIVIKTERERYYIPIAEISETVKLYGVKRAFELMLPKVFSSERAV